MKLFNIVLINFVIKSLSFNIDNIDKFKNWIYKHDIKINNIQEHERIFKNWINNDEYINRKNSLNLSYKLEHNKFSGMEINEFISFIGLKKSNNTKSVNNNQQFYDINSNVAIAKSIDWRNNVNEIKDQGYCGSCWAFSTICSLESAYSIKYNNMVTLSEQELLNCDNRKNGGTNFGCNGGNIEDAYKWIQKNNGITSNENNIYISGETGKTDKCIIHKTVNNTKIIDYVKIEETDNDMIQALNKQVVSIAIQADTQDFQLYSSGVFTGNCGVELDHAVNLVGYGTLDNQDYYILRNSWGKTWGLDGYMLIGRGDYNGGKGQCGLLMEGSYPRI
jgi:hypothetical protein